MKNARRLLYEQLTLALSGRAPVWQSSFSSLIQQSSSGKQHPIIGGKPTTYNKGFAVRDW
jgi:hypothetical protein